MLLVVHLGDALAEPGPHHRVGVGMENRLFRCHLTADQQAGHAATTLDQVGAVAARTERGSLSSTAR